MSIMDSIETVQTQEDKKGLTGADLKVLAILTMTIDHIAAVLIDPKTDLYLYMRAIGRIAFPIFCFLLTEGVAHTKNRIRYIGNLFLFAIISSPFYMVIPKEEGEISNNVFFTLFFGAACICMIEYIKQCIPDRDSVLLMMLRTFIEAAIFIGCFISSIFMHTSYEGVGVFVIVLFYYFPRMLKNRLPEKFTRFVCCLAFCWDSFQQSAIVSFIPITTYNGERGKQNKWLFYIYYPAHLLVLFLIKKYVLKLY